MLHFGPEKLTELLDFPSLIKSLEAAFCADWNFPQRHHHDFANPKAGTKSTLLLMPAWSAGEYLGVKTVVVAPRNDRYQLPAIQGIYTLFDADTGQPLAQMDAPMLTALRTAASSALASSYLSRKDSKTLLMIGTGVLAPHLIKAHAAVRPIDRVFVWGRNFAKAEKIQCLLAGTGFQVEAIKNIAEVISEADIISCATLSKTPLVFGRFLKPGHHVDLVGAYRPDMREADDEAILKSSIFLDSRASVPLETGDLAIPLQSGLITDKKIKADLFDLSQKKHPGRISTKEITLFKSVGLALEDLAAAILAFEKK